jgi:hypothetical protein
VRLRIVGNGEKIRIQRKKLFGWAWEGWVTGAYDCTWVQPHEFKTVDAAMQHIRRTYGESAEVDRPWIVLAPAPTGEAGKP